MSLTTSGCVQKQFWAALSVWEAAVTGNLAHYGEEMRIHIKIICYCTYNGHCVVVSNHVLFQIKR
jgi:hypothetical protein